MKLTRTETYLSLLKRALESKVIPELTSSEGRETAEVMQTVLAELIKRERAMPRILERHIAEGEEIARHMAALLKRFGAEGAGREWRACSRSDFESLAVVQAELTHCIDRNANALVALRSSAKNDAEITMLLRRAAEWERAFYVADHDADGAPQPMVDTGRGGPLTRELLETFLRRVHPDGEKCAVTSFEPTPGGYSKQTFRVTLRDASGKDHALIVRKNARLQSMAFGGFLIDHEFYLLRDAYANGLAVAEPLYLGVDVPGVESDFYVMTALPGTLAGTFLGGLAETVSEDIFLHMAELLVRMHRLKLEQFPGYFARFGNGGTLLRETVESCYRRRIAEAKAYFGRLEFLPSPYLTYLFDWLERNVPRSDNPPVLIHGDFYIHNLLAVGNRVTGILDWECAAFGAPEQDLAYIRPHLARHLDWERFIAHYRACGGADIDEKTMNFCQVLSCLLVGISCNKTILNVQQGIDPSVRTSMVELGIALRFMNMGLASSLVESADMANTPGHVDSVSLSDLSEEKPR